MSQYHIALVNIAHAKTDFEDPPMRSFIAQLSDINALADRSPGFVWRQSAEPNDYLRPYDDQRILFNLSVWQDIESAHKFVYRSAHVGLLQRRAEWFTTMAKPHLALWWVHSGNIPSVAEAQSRLAHIQATGPSPYAFSFKQRYPAPADSHDNG